MDTQLTHTARIQLARSLRRRYQAASSRAKKQVQKAVCHRKWSERPDVVALSSGLSAPNRTCTLQRIRLSISGVAHSKDKIGVMRFEDIALLLTQDVRVAFRQPPSELTLTAGHQSPQCDT